MAQSKIDLFLELATPDKHGKSRWVKTTEFVGKYAPLQLGNGCDFARASSPLRKKYIVEFDKSITPGNRIDAIRLNGINENQVFNQAIRPDIREAILRRRCVMLGVNGTSENTTIEVDHKDGRKDDWRVSNPSTQRMDDFQPLCKAANDIKRQICKQCKANNIRWDAKKIEGNPYSFYDGDEHYTESLGCVGCYQYDPVEYRVQSAVRLSTEATDYILNKLYPDYEDRKRAAML